MTESRQGGFQLSDTYLHLGGGGEALPVAGGDAFWKALVGGDHGDPAIARVASEPGYLIGGFRMESDSAHWEMHPEGDEIIHLVSGAVNFVLQEADGKRTIKLRDRGCCLVPRGVWHRVLVRRTSEIVFITFGRGTQHRAVEPWEIKS